MGLVSIVSNFLGLNTRSHPTRLVTENGSYVTKAVNVDITHGGAVERRRGRSVVVSDLVDAHSIYSVGDRYVLYADGVNLFAFDVESETTASIKSDLTAQAKVGYTGLGDGRIVFCNGVERGIVDQDLTISEYPNAEPRPDRQLVDFPLSNIMHVFSGSMYGGVINSKFVYCSEPYRYGEYDPTAGYIPLPGGLRWISNLSIGVLLGLTNGVVLLEGSSYHDFKMIPLKMKGTMSCSERIEISIRNEEDIRHGVLAQCEDGIFFIDDSMTVTNMTRLIKYDWSELQPGTLSVLDDNFIFSGEKI